MKRSLLIYCALILFLSGNATWADSSIDFMSGGIGKEGREAMKEAEANYNLEFVFTGKEGEYLSDIHVDIVDASDNLVGSTRVEGPYLLVKANPGKYMLKASYGDKQLTHQFSINKSGMLKKEFLRFPFTYRHADDTSRDQADEALEMYNSDLED